MSHAKQLPNPHYFDDSMESSNRAGLPGNGKRALSQQVHHAVIATVQSVLAQALEEELTMYLGGARYERLPWGRGPHQTRSGSARRE
jgi:hypothetical protein